MAQSKSTTTKRKGNPAKQAEALRISQIGDFKKRMGGRMELPSGAVVKLKNPGGLQAFIGGSDASEVPNQLMTIIQESLAKGQAPTMKSMVNEDGTMDPQLMEDMQLMMERVVAKTVVEPPVQQRPTQKVVDDWNAANPDDTYESVDEYWEREDILFANEFPDVDKQFIFQWVTGGVKDLESFREKQQQMLGALESGDEPEGDTK